MRLTLLATAPRRPPDLSASDRRARLLDCVRNLMREHPVISASTQHHVLPDREAIGAKRPGRVLSATATVDSHVPNPGVQSLLQPRTITTRQRLADTKLETVRAFP
jgi:hypothetical protein